MRCHFPNGRTLKSDTKTHIKINWTNLEWPVPPVVVWERRLWNDSARDSSSSSSLASRRLPPRSPIRPPRLAGRSMIGSGPMGCIFNVYPSSWILVIATIFFCWQPFWGCHRHCGKPAVLLRRRRRRYGCQKAAAKENTSSILVAESET